MCGLTLTCCTHVRLLPVGGMSKHMQGGSLEGQVPLSHVLVCSTARQRSQVVRITRADASTRSLLIICKKAHASCAFFSFITELIGSPSYSCTSPSLTLGQKRRRLSQSQTLQRR